MIRYTVLSTLIAAMMSVGAAAGEHHYDANSITDVHEIYFGPQIEAIPGEPALFIPIRINTSRPTIGVNIIITYDPSLLTPTVVAPNLFFQNFQADMSIQGRIRINLLTDLPPPPFVPPIEGDTIFAWISCCVTSEDLGYDLLTHIGFYEDPNTPYPDNSLLLADGNWVVYPNLSLTRGDVLIINPIYGDININGFAFEIGDAITFLNYFMGDVQFTRRQYANSDCNRDGIQASIADLVFLLGVINGDRLLQYDPPFADRPESISEYNSRNSLDSHSLCDIVLNSDESLGGAYFVLDYDSDLVEPSCVLLDNSADDLELSWTASNGKLMIALYSWRGYGSMFSSGKLLSILYSGDSGLQNDIFAVSRAEFSTSDGEPLDAEYEIDYTYTAAAPASMPTATAISILGYPNPFNGAVSISYDLPSDGDYDLMIFDILGRQVKSLMRGNQRNGKGSVIWDGTDNRDEGVASGIYFARLRGEKVSASLKLFMMK